MTATDIPDEIRRLADARQAARDARDFATADRLKADIESGGWKVVDQRTSYRLQRAWPDDVVDADGRVRYGWSGSVPARLDAPPRGVATVVLVAPDDPDVLERALAGLASAVADDVQRIVVGAAPGPEAEAMLARLAAHWASDASPDEPERVPAGEVVWLAARAGVAAALNAGIRRAAAAVVILLDAAVEVVGDAVTPLVRALDDPTVAVAGPWGSVSDDQRQFEPAAAADAGPIDVTAVNLAAMAFRRADYAGRGPLDEGFVESPLLDAWWSLVLRDPEGDEKKPRRAVLVDAPIVRPSRGGTGAGDEPDDRLIRRNRYRLINTFGGRRDLAVPRPPG